MTIFSHHVLQGCGCGKEKNVLGRQFLRNKTPEDQQQINSRSFALIFT